MGAEVIRGSSSHQADAGMTDGKSIGIHGALGFGGLFALQFSFICVLANVSGNFTWGITTNGPAFIWSWVLGGLLQLSVALAMAELTSAFPVAGACYSWLRRLSHPSLAWFTGYLLLFGYIAALADNDSGLSSSLLSFAGITHPSRGYVIAVALACLGAQAAFSVLSLRVLARSAMLAVSVQLLVLIGVVAGLTILGLRQSPAVLLDARGITVHEHMPRFLLMLMIPVWTILGFDAAANLGDETGDAPRTAPRALMAATLASFVGGTALIAVPLLAMDNFAKTASATSSFHYILQTRIGAGVATFVDAVVVAVLLSQPVVLQMVAGRLLWAQARDGAWPSAGGLVRLNRWGAPARAIGACTAIAAILCLAWPVVYGLGTVWPALWMLAYCIAIAAGLSAKLKMALPRERGWNFGRWGVVNDMAAIGWLAFLVVLLPLFDAFHAVPGMLAVVVAGLLAYNFWIKPRWHYQQAVFPDPYEA